MKKLEDYVRCIPDFPSKGIMFRDITSVIQDPDGLKLAIDSMIEAVRDVDFDVVVGTESRDLFRAAKRANFHVRQLQHRMPLNMERLRLKFIRMQ